MKHLDERVKRCGKSVTSTWPDDEVKRLRPVVDFDKMLAIDAAA
jgi:hypothetical protein